MKLNARLNRLLRENNIIIILALILIYAVAFINHFTKTKNLMDLLLHVSMYGILAIGLSFVLMVGYIDLSVGYQAALSGTVAVLISNSTGNVFLGVIIGIVCATAWGTLNGLLVTKWRIAPLIATIASMITLKGVIRTITDNVSVGAKHESFKQIFRTKLFNYDVLSVSVVVFAVLLIVFGIVLRKTRFGANIYVTGGNAEAGKLAGINTSKIVLAAYFLCGLCCGIAGIFIASKANAGTISLGDGLDVLTISACVIGGVKMQGGYGSMVKVFLGILTMRVITNIMNLKALHTAWVLLITGLVLIAVLILDRFTRRESD